MKQPSRGRTTTHGTLLTIGLVVGVAAIGTWTSILSPTEARTSVIFATLTAAGTCVVLGRHVVRSGGRLLMPGHVVGYFQAVSLVVGLIAYMTLRSGAVNPEADSLAFTANVHSLALVGFMAFYLLPSGPSTSTRGFIPEAAKLNPHGMIGLVALALLSAVGMYLITLPGLDLRLLVTDPAQVRSVTQSLSPSGVSWLLYKLFLPLTVIAIAVIAPSRVRAKALSGGILVVFLAYLTYGGRLQPLLLLLVVAIAVDSFRKRIRPSQVVAAALVLATLAILFAGYRYFSSYEQDTNRQRVEATTLRQFSGTVAELGDTRRMISVPSLQARNVLHYELYVKTIPSALRTTVSPPSGGVTFGQYAAALQRRPDSGGLRVAPAGEWSLSYGTAAALWVGLVIGACCRALDHLVSSASPIRKVVGIVGLSQVLFVMVTGSANAFSSGLVVIATAIFAGLTMKTNHGASSAQSALEGSSGAERTSQPATSK